jgi:hypothetical protein
MLNSHGSARLALAGLLIACVGLAACGDDGVAPAVSSPASLPPDTTVTTDVTVPSPAPVAIVGVYEAVKAYPACGNEPLDHDGVTWYPVTRVGFDPFDGSLQARADEILAVDREVPPSPPFQSLARRVQSPGPGDDVGTLVVWADGVARWVSDSGKLDVWLVDDEITYNWVC